MIGDNPFGIDLYLVVEDETVEGRKAVIQHLSIVEQANQCQIVFINQSEQAHVTRILTYLQKYPILTVSDMENFVQQGGMVQFFNTVRQKVRFIIAPETVMNAELKVSANLLEIAHIFRY